MNPRCGHSLSEEINQKKSSENDNSETGARVLQIRDPKCENTPRP